MTQDLSIFKREMDDWVKDFNGRLEDIRHIPCLVKEHSENIDHNYELIQEMRAEMNKMREEMAALRLVQILHLKTEIERKH